MSMECSSWDLWQIVDSPRGGIPFFATGANILVLLYLGYYGMIGAEFRAY